MKNKLSKETKRTAIITTIICFIPIIIGACLYNRLPDTIATHWDFKGNANGFSSKFVGVIVFPGILAVLNIFTPFMFSIDPKYTNAGEKIKAVIQWIFTITSVFCTTITLGSALGYDINVELFAPIFAGILFTVIGNFLPKTKQTYTIGIRVPWTLNSEENWNKTHRMAGYLWVVCGILFIASAFLPESEILYTILLCVIIFVPIIYSYVIYRKENK